MSDFDRLMQHEVALMTAIEGEAHFVSMAWGTGLRARQHCRQWARKWFPGAAGVSRRLYRRVYEVTPKPNPLFGVGALNA